MKALKIALLSAVAIGLTAPAFAQTADTNKPAVSAQTTPSAKSDVKTDAGKPSATVDSKSTASASATTESKNTDKPVKKSAKKHHKPASTSPAKSTTTVPAKTGKSSS